MSDILKLLITFLLIVLLLRRKLNIGWVLIIASASVALFYRMPPGLAFRAAGGALLDAATLKLLFALSLIRMFEMVLREKNIMAGMMEAANGLLRSKRAAIVSMPLLIGMLPSVGGAYFSAPMVDESTKGLKMSGEEKSFINYWYRHPWEFILPLYPGLVLASAISGIALRKLMLANLACAAVMAASGFFVSMRGIGGRPEKKFSKRGLYSFIPIGAVIALVVVFRLELHIALLIALAGLLIVYRYGLSVFRVIKYGVSLDVIVLIAGVMLFKGMMGASGAVENLSRSFGEWGVPLLPMLFVLPFAVGVLTGITIGFVGSTFPLLMSLAGGGSLNAVSFAFVSGFIGVLLSPVHVCLVLTREYFKADMSGIYRRMIPAVGAVLAAALAGFLILNWSV